MELVHTNVWGKSFIPSLGGSLYFVTFIDDTNRKVWIYFFKQKSDVFDMFKKLTQIENETSLKFKCLKSDSGGGYCDNRFEEFCANRGIKRVKMVSENLH